ncbi:acyl-CoA thioesterase [Lysinibacillus odysseyi]|uniref:Thioesterase n=1 Tax=Lysinibacillus odysseyi 34hs-1 = NBRC 100172 TaxID=1220589 RepID=A0A0A3J6L4_9BACI|nr:thioesterase family protein [Lysinibacillus odysseyi]KGR82712.1 thioesterase [Lysinibacillus odysseyi 34hs-1 = NBRC 100172]
MFETIIQPRVSETDGVGHINNTTIPVWLEAGRNELFKIFNPEDDFENWRMVIVKSCVEYKAQIYFGKDALIKCWIKRIGNASLELYEEIWQGNTKCITASTIYVNFNTQEQKSEPIPPSIKSVLENHLYEEVGQ